MMNLSRLKYFLFPLGVVVLIAGAYVIPATHIQEILTDTLASVFFTPSVTAQDLQNRYADASTTQNPSSIAPYMHAPQTVAQLTSTTTPAKKIRILVDPQHDNTSWGAEYHGIKEADLTLQVSNDLTAYLQQDPRFDVVQTRTGDGSFTPTFQNYFDTEKDAIMAFRNQHAATMKTLENKGLVTSDTDAVDHGVAPSETVVHLYGVNKWADENNIDLVLASCFNDYPGHGSGPGKYTGTALYVPDHQYSNAAASKTLANSVYTRLTQFVSTSDYPPESSGIVEDQQLIVTGAFNTLDPAVFLAEYGYLYESQYVSPDVRPLALKELAYQTYLGVLDFLHDKPLGTARSAILPHTWNTDLSNGDTGSADVFAMQTALHLKNYYPPTGNTLADCPINGNFGPCTEQSVKDFQTAQNISPASGYVGPETRAALNSLFGGTTSSLTQG